MGAFIDLAGRKFNRLTVVRRSGIARRTGVVWECLCDCGRLVNVDAANLKRGTTKSCGCKKAEPANNGMYRHGLTKSPTYKSWCLMKSRCSNPKSSQWAHYGGKGIRVCERWNDFDNFLADMGERPSAATIDRIDSNGNYEPGNCRWATQAEQIQNQKRIKLDVEKVRKIRALAATGSGMRELGRQFSVGHNTIAACVHRRSWANVA